MKFRLLLISFHALFKSFISFFFCKDSLVQGGEKGFNHMEKSYNTTKTVFFSNLFYVRENKSKMKFNNRL